MIRLICGITPRGVHVAAEDLAVQAERDHALLDAGAGALVDADDRAAGLDREVHHLGDLLAVDLAERAAEDGEVLGEHADLAAVDGAVAGDHAVAVRAGSSPGRTRSSGAGPARRARRTSPRRRAARSARGRSCLPLACCFSTAFAEPAWTASSRRRSRSASLPAVVWMSMSVGDVGAFAGVCAHACATLVVVAWTHAARPPSTPTLLATAAGPLPGSRSRWSGGRAPPTPVATRPTPVPGRAGRGRRAPDRRSRPARPRPGRRPPGRALTFSAVLRPRARRRAVAVAAAAGRGRRRRCGTAGDRLSSVG